MSSIETKLMQLQDKAERNAIDYLGRIKPNAQFAKSRANDLIRRFVRDAGFPEVAEAFETAISGEYTR